MESILLDLTEVDAQEHYVHSLTQIFATTILFWDHFITFDTEINFIWLRPKSRGAITFLAFRYLTLMTNISVLIFSFYPLDPEKCRNASFYGQVLLLISQVTVCTLLTFRIYALYCFDRRILWFYGATVMFAGGYAGFVLSGQDKVHYPILAECHTGISHQTAFRIAGLWLTLFAYDTIIFSLTASRTYQFWRKAHLQRLRPSLLSLLFRDGAMYFGIMALVNLANILTFYLCGPFMRGGLSTFASCISATLLCRLMLNLHTSADTGLYTRQDTTLSWRIGTLSAMVNEESLEQSITSSNTTRTFRRDNVADASY